MGGTLSAVMESDLANAYRFEIYLNSSVVFFQQGLFDDGEAAVSVALNPPSFKGGNTYMVVLDAYAMNSPIPGAYFSDSAVSMFSVVRSETKLGLTAQYDGLFGSLHLSAQLAYGDSSSPVANETVSFSLQRAHTGRLTEGWLPLGSRKTNSSGSAELNIAFGLPDGDYYVKVVHKANENFGASENKTDITTSFKAGIEGAFGIQRSSGRFYSPSSVGNLTIAVSSVSPYALLSMNGTSRYVSETPLPGPFNFIFFYIDDASNGAFAGYPVTSSRGPLYIYETELIWTPEVTGSHSLIAGIASGDISAMAEASRNGTGLITTVDVALEIQRCPSNIALSYPEAVYGDALPVTAAVTMPTIYEANSTEFYNLTTLGSRFTYNSAEYAFTSGISSASLGLHVNGTWVDGKASDPQGVADFQVNMNFKTARVKVVFDGGSLFAASFAEESVSFSKVRVYDKTNVTNTNFQFNFTANGVLDPAEIYVGFENMIEAEASLLNQSVRDLPMMLIYARLVSSSTTNSSGKANVPEFVDYLWIFNTTVFVGDVNEDRKTDVRDLAIIVKAYGSHPGDANWNVDADINHDNTVDIKDSAAAAKYYGKFDDRVVFNNGVEVYLDNKGFARIPSGATSLTLFKTSSNGYPTPNNSVAFFDISFNETFPTNSLGRVGEMWIPAEEQIGRYVVQFKSLTKFDVSTTSSTTLTGLDAQANVFKFVDVKRPIDLNVTYTPSQPVIDDVVTMTVRAYDFGLGSPMADYSVEFYVWNYLNNSFVYMGSSVTNSSGIATFAWTPRYYVDRHFSSGSLLLSVRIVDSGQNVLAEKTPVRVDARYPTHLEYVMGGDVINVNVGQTYQLAVKLVRNDTNPPLPVYGQRIDFYRNGSFVSWDNTDSNGIAYTDWTVERRETYYHKAVMLDRDPVFGSYRPSNEARLMAVAVSVPTTIDFDVQPRDFSPGTLLTLNATVRNAVSGDLMNNFLVSFYKVGQSGTRTLLGNTSTTNGVALMSYLYSSGPYAFMAEAATGGTVISSSGIMLTASYPTTLTLNVTKDDVSYKHGLSGSLKTGSSGMVGSVIRILVNDTEVKRVTTTDGGQFAATLTLKPLSSAAVTYTIIALFDGYGVHNASAYDSSPDGQRYAVSTTIDYGYKPSSNSVSLTVGPQATLAAVTTKTMGQLQQEAGQKGWIRPRHDFSIWHPWYTLHLISVFRSEDVLDMGIAPLGNDIIIRSTTFNSWITNFAAALLKGYAIGFVAAEVAVLVAMRWGWEAFVITFLASVGAKLLMLIPAWNSVQAMQSAVVGAFISFVLGAHGLIKMIDTALLDVANSFLATATGADWWKFLYKIIYLPINAIFMMLALIRLGELGYI